VPLTTLLLILTAQTGGTSRGALSGVISSSNYSGTALGGAIGGLLGAHLGFASLSYLLGGAVLFCGLLMVVGLNDQSSARARAHFDDVGGRAD
jgi:predicted MFS family arabinose efflux permease